VINKAITLIKIHHNKTVNLEDKSYDCIECRKRKYYLQRNCDGGNIPKPNITSEKVRFVVDKGTVLNYCPKILLYDEEVEEILSLYAFWKNGMMPFDGGIYNQPYYYYKAMIMINNAVSEIEAEQLNSGG
jgi:hypothetical protein